MINKGVTLAELQKQTAYMNHKAALRDTNTCGLPYRICLDAIKDTESNNAFINPYYPLNGIPPAYIWHYDTDGHITPEQWHKLTFKPNGERNNEGKPYYTFITPPIAKQGQEDKARPCKLWDMETDHGRQHWIYWFAAFLIPYADRIEKFSVFDMFGDTKHTTNDLRRQQDYYTEIIKACTKKPNLYRQGIVKQGEYIEILQKEYDILSDTGIYPELLEQIEDIIQTLTQYTDNKP